MHKSRQFINKSIKTYEKDIRIKNHLDKNIIFLDIDGVIQPPYYERRFEHDMEALQYYLANKYSDDIYLTFDKYDLAAAYYDWSYIALGYLKELIEETGSYIVLHSTWGRHNTTKQIIALFKLYDLDNFIIDIINEDNDKKRCIHHYLSKHFIDYFIIIDDDYGLLREFGSYCCLTSQYFQQSDFDYCQFIFQNPFSFSTKEKDHIKTFEMISYPSQECLGQVFFKVHQYEDNKICLFYIHCPDQYREALLCEFFSSMKDCDGLMSEQYHLLKNQRIGYVTCDYEYHHQRCHFYYINHRFHHFNIQKFISQIKETFHSIELYKQDNGINLTRLFSFI